MLCRFSEELFLVRLACILAAALWLTPQQEPEELNVEQELAALIEKTNALETFHLVYDMTSPGEETPTKATLEFLYRAPDLARMHVTGDEGEMDVWMDEAQMVLRSDLDEEDGAWHRALFPEPLPASLALDEFFPNPESPIGPGAFLGMKVRDDSETGKAAFEVSFGQASQGRAFLLGWLANLRKRSDELSIEDQSLSFVLAGEHYRLRVSRASGVLERVEADSSEGAIQLDLRECHLDEPLEEGLIEMPAAARAAALDPDMTRSLGALSSSRNVRHEAFLRLENQLQTDKLPWNERTRKDWGTVLDALHRPMVTEKNSGWIDELHEHVDQLAEWVSTQRAENDSPERHAELKQRVAEYRAKLEENFDSSQTGYVENLPSIESDRSEPRQELFDMEAEIIAELWDELLREPVLSAYDEKLAEALE